MRDLSEILAQFDKSSLITCDTTLRDGEQAAGIVFANLEKLRTAKLLDELGVQQIEAGIPAMGGDEKNAVKKIASWAWTLLYRDGTGPTRRTWRTPSIAMLIR
ncbi:MAG: hypothetical protein MZV65_47060 [Chromatiales bacterium]|nr:hypothetical protein [Chromatiales bacterium]